MKALLPKIFVTLCLLHLLPSPNFATTIDNNLLLQWDKEIEQAGSLIKQQATTIDDLERNRQKLIKQRDQSLTKSEETNSQLSILQAQLDVIGKTPDKGTMESQQIATRRNKLQSEISQLTETLLDLTERSQQLDMLIERVDASIGQKSTTNLLTRGPSPVIISNWPAALIELKSSLAYEKQTLLQVIARPETQSILKNRLPLVILLFFLGIINITLVSHIVLVRLIRPDRFSKEQAVNWQGMALSCAHLLIPSISAGLFIAGFYLLQIDISGLRKAVLLSPLIILFLVIGHWLGHTLFSPKHSELRIFKVDDSQAATGYKVLLSLGLCLSVLTAQELLETGYTFTEGSKGILSLPIILVGSVLLWMLSCIIRQSQRNMQEKSRDRSDIEFTIQTTLLHLLSLLLRVAALFSLLFIVMGFTNLSRGILEPMLATVAILSFCLFLFKILIAILEPLLSRGSIAQESTPTLLPLGIIGCISLFILPVLALNWGMRWATLVDIGWALKEGIKIGDIRFSLDIIFLFVIVFALGLGITRWMQKLFRVAILPRTKLDLGGQNALVTGTGYIGITLSALIAISFAGIDLSSLAIFAGALSVGIGFGLQTIASNFVSGIILLVERPIKVGDWIDVTGFSGYVRKISVRSTRIETFDRHDVIIPNAELVAGVVKNMTLTGNTGRVVVPVGVAYGTDAEKVRSLLLDIATKHEMVLKFPASTVLFMGLGESSIDLELRCFVKDVNSMLTVRSDMYFTIYKTLEKEGIEIPFPQRVVTLKSCDSP